MSNVSISDRTLLVLEKALDLLSTRQQATANNIANVDTPGYRAQRFEFEAELRRAIESRLVKSSPVEDRIRRVRGSVRTDSGPARADGNSVQMEREIGRLAQTGARYTMLTKIVAAKLRALQDIAADRG